MVSDTLENILPEVWLLDLPGRPVLPAFFHTHFYKFPTFSSGSGVIKINTVKVNKQDFLQVFEGSEIGKMGDNLTSADPLSYTTNG